MKRLLSEPVQEIHYEADAAILWCFDDRFSGLLPSLLRHEEFAWTDLIKVAGGAKALATPENECERDFVLGQIEKSIRLHKSPLIFLMVHAGCGAYGKKFSNYEEEQAFYLGELEKAEKTLADFLASRNLSAKILKFYGDFEGLVQV